MAFNRRFRAVLVFIFDLMAVVTAWFAAYFLRFNFDWQIVELYQPWNRVLLILLVTQLFACRWVRLYRGMWFFASIPDLVRVLKAVLVSAVVLLFIEVFFGQTAKLPRSIVVLYPILLVLIMGGGRFLWRIYKEYLRYGREQGAAKPVIVLGAGTAGAMLIRELERTRDWNVVAIHDDDRTKWGLEILGCRVKGAIDQLPESLEEHGAKHVIMAMPTAPKEVLQKITLMATEAKASVFTVPGLAELMSGRVAINMMRPVKIEDLLGREPVYIDTEHVEKMIANKSVLVTGAGGSIGSELCKQISRFKPERLILVETSEFALYLIEQWLRDNHPGLMVVPLTGDVKDKVRMNEIFELWKPHLVFHAAAFKHVPLMEVGNAWQAVRNNVLGTLNVAECALEYQAERFILISTDKAVNPTNVMGATKRMAEMVCEVLHSKGSETQFNMVRFGNVLGSTGSVIPKFKDQIARGGPVTVTHPDINRYFMSIPEAAQLVLQAASMGQGGEVFVLDMGEPVKIVDLARNMIRLSGFTEDQIRIEFSGLRPGEKLYEELLTDAEETRSTPHPKLRIARSRTVPDGFYEYLGQWLIEETVSDANVRIGLKKWIPEYTPMKG
ncbi:multidrug MFS transporter [Oligella sp. HMSC05A10]|uniref:nucleoside-diphosphate sugar epimerase/dehydratase n=1 Tax=Oligella sp. HMSC05A10 TaxID=1581112 RepID=UPI0008A39AC1|nr:nucleoside-diphosphate sugar epimerase/dehydratase [Oligella sp. HMSC05A10]OFS87260.1 multidrug MFS transporter [Oligella sp. HMSC05A10]